MARPPRAPNPRTLKQLHLTSDLLGIADLIREEIGSLRHVANSMPYAHGVKLNSALNNLTGILTRVSDVGSKSADQLTEFEGNFTPAEPTEAPKRIDKKGRERETLPANGIEYHTMSAMKAARNADPYKIYTLVEAYDDSGHIIFREQNAKGCRVGPPRGNGRQPFVPKETPGQLDHQAAAEQLLLGSGPDSFVPDPLEPEDDDARAMRQLGEDAIRYRLSNPQQPKEENEDGNSTADEQQHHGDAQADGEAVRQPEPA